MAGSCQIQVSDGQKQQTYELKDPLRGLYVPRMIFIELTDFTPDAICLVLVNTHYQNETVIPVKAEYRQRLQENIMAGTMAATVKRSRLLTLGVN
ncbi:MAG: WxcM-like domain-containing protein [Chloroflexi bacterium]|nr:WxcM-like domain-containing protein [Chloroflexota bacterium]